MLGGGFEELMLEVSRSQFRETQGQIALRSPEGIESDNGSLFGEGGQWKRQLLNVGTLQGLNEGALAPEMEVLGRRFAAQIPCDVFRQSDVLIGPDQIELSADDDVWFGEIEDVSGGADAPIRKEDIPLPKDQILLDRFARLKAKKIGIDEASFV